MNRGWVVVALLAAGCASEGGSDVPMATDGPNQVVVKVPGMT
ncbi:MAG TPA: hypothetical protein VM529_21605 [Gemmata sp.]|nr:hypothetical protein [Gemmata sp.]